MIIFHFNRYCQIAIIKVVSIYILTVYVGPNLPRSGVGLYRQSVLIRETAEPRNTSFSSANVCSSHVPVVSNKLT